MLERFETKISFLEYSRDLTKMSLSELVNALQAEQRRVIREKNVTEGSLVAKMRDKASSSNASKSIMVKRNTKTRKRVKPIPTTKRKITLRIFAGLDQMYNVEIEAVWSH